MRWKLLWGWNISHTALLMCLQTFLTSPNCSLLRVILFKYLALETLFFFFWHSYCKYYQIRLCSKRPLNETHKMFCTPHKHNNFIKNILTEFLTSQWVFEIRKTLVTYVFNETKLFSSQRTLLKFLDMGRWKLKSPTHLKHAIKFLPKSFTLHRT